MLCSANMAMKKLVVVMVMIMIDLAGVIAQAPCQNQLGQTCSQSLRNLFRAGFHDDSLDDYDVMLILLMIMMMMILLMIMMMMILLMIMM